jgi:aspartate/glutamate racemase
MKTIAIIGGMGPQASVHAHKILVSELTLQSKHANIVHVSLNTSHFFRSNAKFQLSREHKELLWPYSS